MQYSSVLPGHWGDSGFTGFYRVLPGFTGFSPVFCPWYLGGARQTPELRVRQPVSSLSVKPRKRVFLFCGAGIYFLVGYVPILDIAHTGLARTPFPRSYSRD